MKSSNCTQSHANKNKQKNDNRYSKYFRQKLSSQKSRNGISGHQGFKIFWGRICLTPPRGLPLWMNKWMNEESWMRGQQTYPLKIHFNMWTVSSDVNIQRRHWQLLSVPFWAYCTHPTHDVNDVMSEGWPQHLWCMLMWFIHENILIYILKRLNSLQIRQNLQNSPIALKHKP